MIGPDEATPTSPGAKPRRRSVAMYPIPVGSAARHVAVTLMVTGAAVALLCLARCPS